MGEDKLSFGIFPQSNQNQTRIDFSILTVPFPPVSPGSHLTSLRNRAVWGPLF